MERRDFLKQVAAWSAGLTLAPPLMRLGRRVEAAGPPLVAVARGKNWELLVEHVLQPLGGMRAFVKPGDRVVVKPNIGWDRLPEQAACTHPQVVKATVRLALAAGARQVQVFDRPCQDERRCYASSGIQAAVESIGDKRVRCEFLDERRWMPVRIERGRELKDWNLYRDAIEADCYINVPVAKVHKIARLTLGLKNVMGVMGGGRGKIHAALPQSIADLATVVRPRLTIIDATRILVANGPTGGNLADVRVLDTLVASPDIVAADSWAAGLFGLKPTDVAGVEAAALLGLGERDLARIRVVEVRA